MTPKNSDAPSRRSPTAISRTAAEPRPAKAERDERRRAEIVAAARACVLRHGFHAASMAEIAAQARMSVGQIYRYFPNKDAIVNAIVEAIVSQRLDWIAATGLQFDLAGVLANRMLATDPREREDDALMLEVTAEASRNPVVAEFVRQADRRLHAQALAAVLQGHPGLSREQASARVEFMAVLSEGTAFRRVTEPPADPALLAGLYRAVIEQLLPGAQSRPIADPAPRSPSPPAPTAPTA